MKLAQVSFTGGEISPSLAMRVDLARYQTSLKVCRNFIVRPTGGVSNRSGTRYVDTLAGEGVLIPFVFSAEQAYVLVFTDEAIDVYADGAQVGTTIVSPYPTADLARLRFTQSADVLTITHPSYPQYEFRRLTSTTFEIAEIDDFEDGPFLDENKNEAITVKASAATGSVTLTASTGIFEADHVGALFRLDEQDLSEIPPWEPSKHLVFQADTPNNPVGFLRRSDGKVYKCATNEASGAEGIATGTVRPTHDKGIESDGDGKGITGFASRAGVEWEYQHSGFGIARITAVANSTTATATVISLLPDSVVNPDTTNIWAFGAWSDEQGYPSLCTYYQDRLVFASTPGQPQTEWASKTGDYHNFGTSSPLVDDDSIAQTLNARQINEIRELVPLDQLIALTASSSWASPQRGEAWTPATIGFYPQAYDGAAAVRSAIVGDTALYVDKFGTKVRDIRYQFEIDKFSGNELTVMSRHLFKRTKTIVDMDYAKEPHGILWCIRSDGALIGLTYLREHDVIGWHRHDTSGSFERVCMIPENGGDAVYLIAQRTIGGSEVRYLERFAERDVDELEDHIFMDAALSYDGRITDGTTATLSGSTWTAGSALTCTLSGSTTFAGNLPDELLLSITYEDDDGEEVTDSVRLTVVSQVSTSVVNCEPITDVPESLQAVATDAWRKMYDTYTGLDHLEGEEVAVLADGSVETGHVVESGSITLVNAASVVHVGLPVTADIETLDINIFGAQSIRADAKNFARLAVVVEDTRGLKAGADADHLEDVAETDDGDAEGAANLNTGPLTYYIPNTWNENGRVFLRQSYPLPVTILSVMPDVKIGAGT